MKNYLLSYIHKIIKCNHAFSSISTGSKASNYLFLYLSLLTTVKPLCPTEMSYHPLHHKPLYAKIIFL